MQQQQQSATTIAIIMLHGHHIILSFCLFWKFFNQFEYRYLSGFKVLYSCAHPPLSIKVISMGMTLFPSMARLALP
jgi:hypothetical protein